MNSLKKEQFRVSCFLFALLALLGSATSVTATIYLSDTGWSEPAPGGWDQGTKTGTLTQDVTETIEIISDGVTLDGASHSVTGTGSGNGVYLSARTGVTVKNVNVSQFVYRGIYLRECSYCTLSGNSVSNNRSGIMCLFSNYNNIIGNNVSNNKSGGISLSNSSNNNITSNTCNSNPDKEIGIGIGISIGNSSNNNEVTGNTVLRNYNGINVGNSSNNKLIDNNVSDGGGIDLTPENCTIAN